MVADMLSRYWWTTVFRGALWILFGILIFAQPGISLAALILLFGCFAVVDGFASMAAAIAGRSTTQDWGLLLILGLAGVIVGVMVFLSPHTAAAIVLIWIAIWAILQGVIEIIGAVRLRKEIQGEFWLGLTGFASVAFGVLLLSRPAVGALALLWFIGAFAIVYGALLVVLAFEMRGFVRSVRG